MVNEKTNTIDLYESDSKEVKFEINENIATIKGENKDDVFKILLADREKIIKFRDLQINPEELSYEKLDEYQDVSMRSEIFSKLKKALIDAFNGREQKVNVGNID